MTRRSRLFRSLAAVLLSASLSTVVPAAPATAQPAGGCVATYQLMTQWPGGFQSQVTVTNLSDLTSQGWEVTLQFPDGQNVRPPWGFGIPPLPGEPLRIRNAPWNGAIPPNGFLIFGLIGSYASVNRPPAVTCTLL